jgi:5,10-methylenetetrahydromethanopterin reductase
VNTSHTPNGVPTVGIRIPPCLPVDQLIHAVKRAEDLGFDEVWFPDSLLLWRDVFTTLTAAALGTDRIGLGTAVTNVVTRHPAVLASAARSVAEIAEGRFTLGIGVGNSSVAPIGMRASTGAEMRSALATVRSLLRGEEVDFGNGALSRLRDPRPVPLFMAASGPRNLRLAGAIADGAILLRGVSPTTLGNAAAAVREGARGADRDSVALIASAFCEVTDDVEKSARQLKPIIAGMAQTGASTALALADIQLDVPERIDGIYPDLVHAEDWDAAVEVCSQWVDDASAARFAREFCLFGTADEIARRLIEVHAHGIAGVYLQHVGSYDLPLELIQTIGTTVLPTLRTRTW